MIHTCDDDPRIEAVAREWCSILHSDPGLKIGSVYLGGKHLNWHGYIDLAKRLLAAADAVGVAPPGRGKRKKVAPTPGWQVGFLRR